MFLSWLSMEAAKKKADSGTEQMLNKKVSENVVSIFGSGLNLGIMSS